MRFNRTTQITYLPSIQTQNFPKKKKQNHTQIQSRLHEDGIEPKNRNENKNKFVGLGVPGKKSQNRSCTVRKLGFQRRLMRKYLENR